jgi:hypothetical protein
MFSINLKRSAATLGVVAGVLAAAGPASAQALPGVVGVKAPASAAGPGSILINNGTGDDQMVLAGSKAPRANSSEVAIESATQLNDVEAIDFNALGTQHGGAPPW